MTYAGGCRAEQRSFLTYHGPSKSQEQPEKASARPYISGNPRPPERTRGVCLIGEGREPGFSSFPVLFLQCACTYFSFLLSAPPPTPPRHHQTTQVRHSSL